MEALEDTSRAAELLGVSPRTLEGMRLSGGGPPFVKVGRLVRYRPEALERWLMQNERRSTSDLGRASCVGSVGQMSAQPAESR